MTDTNSKAFLGRGWSFPVVCDAMGEIATAEYEEDIRQAIRIIIGTNKGERMMRPDFGAGLDAFVFEPLNTTTMALVRHQVEQALIEWEPRIDSVTVEVSADPRSGRLDVQIGYRVRSTNAFYNWVYPFYVREGQE
jgi:phage baseplate assembly protein W